MTVWVHQTVLDTDGFVAAVGPVVDRPNVTQAMSVELTTQIFDAIDVERQVKQVLPSQGQFLAAPLTSAAENFVQGQVRNVLRSAQFRALWFTVLRAAHKEVLAALRGQSSVLSVTNGAVVLNTLPLVNAALQQVQSLASGLLGRHVTIPAVTNGELPAQVPSHALRGVGGKAARGLGPDRAGQIQFARPDHQRGPGFRRFVLVAAPIDPFGHLGGIGVVTQPPSDRAADIDRYCCSAGSGKTGTIRGSRTGSSRRSPCQPRRRRRRRPPGAQRVGHGYVVGADRGVGGGGFALTHRAPRARALRARTGAHRPGPERHGRRRPGGEATIAWVVGHRRAMQAAGALVGGVLLLVVPGWWFLAVLLLLGAYEVVIWRVGVDHVDLQATRQTVPPHAGPPLATPPGD